MRRREIIILCWMFSILYLITCLMFNADRFSFWLSGTHFGMMALGTLSYFCDNKLKRKKK